MLPTGEVANSSSPVQHKLWGITAEKLKTQSDESAWTAANIIKLDSRKDSSKVCICFEKHQETYGNLWKSGRETRRETREETSSQKEGRGHARSINAMSRFLSTGQLSSFRGKTGHRSHASKPGKDLLLPQSSIESIVATFEEAIYQ